MKKWLKMQNKIKKKGGLWLKIIIDKQEKKPYLFTGYPCSTDIKHMKTGDYTLDGHEKTFCIERKSMPDLFQTLGQGRSRFKREFERMRKMKASCVIIECDSYLDIFKYAKIHNAKTKKFGKRAISPKSIWHTLISWSQTYKVPVFFVGYDRKYAEKVVYIMLKLWHKKTITNF